MRLFKFASLYLTSLAIVGLVFFPQKATSAGRVVGGESCNFFEQAELASTVAEALRAKKAKAAHPESAGAGATQAGRTASREIPFGHGSEKELADWMKAHERPRFDTARFSHPEIKELSEDVKQFFAGIRASEKEALERRTAAAIEDLKASYVPRTIKTIDEARSDLDMAAVYLHDVARGRITGTAQVDAAYRRFDLAKEALEALENAGVGHPLRNTTAESLVQDYQKLERDFEAARRDLRDVALGKVTDSEEAKAIKSRYNDVQKRALAGGVENEFAKKNAVEAISEIRKRNRVPDRANALDKQIAALERELAVPSDKPQWPIRHKIEDLRAELADIKGEVARGGLARNASRLDRDALALSTHVPSVRKQLIGLNDVSHVDEPKLGHIPSHWKNEDVKISTKPGTFQGKDVEIDTFRWKNEQKGWVNTLVRLKGAVRTEDGAVYLLDTSDAKVAQLQKLMKEQGLHWVPSVTEYRLAPDFFDYLGFSVKNHPVLGEVWASIPDANFLENRLTKWNAHVASTSSDAVHSHYMRTGADMQEAMSYLKERGYSGIGDPFWAESERYAPVGGGAPGAGAFDRVAIDPKTGELKRVNSLAYHDWGQMVQSLFIGAPLQERLVAQGRLESRMFNFLEDGAKELELSSADAAAFKKLRIDNVAAHQVLDSYEGFVVAATGSANVIDRNGPGVLLKDLLAAHVHDSQGWTHALEHYGLELVSGLHPNGIDVNNPGRRIVDFFNNEFRIHSARGAGVTDERLNWAPQLTRNQRLASTEGAPVSLMSTLEHGEKIWQRNAKMLSDMEAAISHADNGLSKEARLKLAEKIRDMKRDYARLLDPEKSDFATGTQRAAYAANMEESYWSKAVTAAGNGDLYFAKGLVELADGSAPKSLWSRNKEFVSPGNGKTEQRIGSFGLGQMRQIEAPIRNREAKFALAADSKKLLADLKNRPELSEQRKIQIAEALRMGAKSEGKIEDQIDRLRLASVARREIAEAGGVDGRAEKAKNILSDFEAHSRMPNGDRISGASSSAVLKKAVEDGVYAVETDNRAFERGVSDFELFSHNREKERVFVEAFQASLARASAEGKDGERFPDLAQSLYHIGNQGGNLGVVRDAKTDSVLAKLEKFNPPGTLAKAEAAERAPASAPAKFVSNSWLGAQAKGIDEVIAKGLFKPAKSPDSVSGIYRIREEAVVSGGWLGEKGRVYRLEPQPWDVFRAARERDAGVFVERATEIWNDGVLGDTRAYYNNQGFIKAKAPGGAGEYLMTMPDARAATAFVQKENAQVMADLKAGKFGKSDSPEAIQKAKRLMFYVEARETGAISQHPMEFHRVPWDKINRLKGEIKPEILDELYGPNAIAFGKAHGFHSEDIIFTGSSKYAADVEKSLVPGPTGQILERRGLWAHDIQQWMNAGFMTEEMHLASARRAHSIEAIMQTLRKHSVLEEGKETRLFLGGDENKKLADRLIAESQNPKAGPQTKNSAKGADSAQGMEIGRAFSAKVAYFDASAEHGFTHTVGWLMRAEREGGISPQELENVRLSLKEGRGIPPGTSDAVRELVAQGEQIVGAEAPIQLKRLGGAPETLHLDPEKLPGVMHLTDQDAKKMGLESKVSGGTGIDQNKVSMHSAIDHWFNGGHDKIEQFVAEVKKFHGVDNPELVKDLEATVQKLKADGILVKYSEKEVAAFKDEIIAAAKEKVAYANARNPNPLGYSPLTKLAVEDLERVSGPKSNLEAFRQMFPYTGLVMNQLERDAKEMKAALEAKGAVADAKIVQEKIDQLAAVRKNMEKVGLNPTAKDQRAFYEAVHGMRATVATLSPDQMAKRAQYLAEDLERYFRDAKGFPLHISGDERMMRALEHAITETEKVGPKDLSVFTKAKDFLTGKTGLDGIFDKKREVFAKQLAAALEKEGVPLETRKAIASFTPSIVETCLAGALCGGASGASILERVAAVLRGEKSAGRVAKADGANAAHDLARSGKSLSPKEQARVETLEKKVKGAEAVLQKNAEHFSFSAESRKAKTAYLDSLEEVAKITGNQRLAEQVAAAKRFDNLTEFRPPARGPLPNAGKSLAEFRSSKDFKLEYLPVRQRLNDDLDIVAVSWPRGPEGGPLLHTQLSHNAPWRQAAGEAKGYARALETETSHSEITPMMEYLHFTDFEHPNIGRTYGTVPSAELQTTLIREWNTAVERVAEAEKNPNRLRLRIESEYGTTTGVGQWPMLNHLVQGPEGFGANFVDFGKSFSGAKEAYAPLGEGKKAPGVNFRESYFTVHGPDGKDHAVYLPEMAKANGDRVFGGFADNPTLFLHDLKQSENQWAMPREAYDAIKKNDAFMLEARAEAKAIEARAKDEMRATLRETGKFSEAEIEAKVAEAVRKGEIGLVIKDSDAAALSKDWIAATEKAKSDPTSLTSHARDFMFDGGMRAEGLLKMYAYPQAGGPHALMHLGNWFVRAERDGVPITWRNVRALLMEKQGVAFADEAIFHLARLGAAGRSEEEFTKILADIGLPKENVSKLVEWSWKKGPEYKGKAFDLDAPVNLNYVYDYILNGGQKRMEAMAREIDARASIGDKKSTTFTDLFTKYKQEAGLRIYSEREVKAIADEQYYKYVEMPKFAQEHMLPGSSVAINTPLSQIKSADELAAISSPFKSVNEKVALLQGSRALNDEVLPTAIRLLTDVKGAKLGEELKADLVSKLSAIQTKAEILQKDLNKARTDLGKARELPPAVEGDRAQAEVKRLEAARTRLSVESYEDVQAARAALAAANPEKAVSSRVGNLARDIESSFFMKDGRPVAVRSDRAMMGALTKAVEASDEIRYPAFNTVESMRTQLGKGDYFKDIGLGDKFLDKVFEAKTAESLRANPGSLTKEQFQKIHAKVWEQKNAKFEAAFKDALGPDRKQIADQFAKNFGRMCAVGANCGDLAPALAKAMERDGNSARTVAAGASEATKAATSGAKTNPEILANLERAGQNLRDVALGRKTGADARAAKQEYELARKEARAAGVELGRFRNPSDDIVRSYEYSIKPEELLASLNKAKRDLRDVALGNEKDPGRIQEIKDAFNLARQDARHFSVENEFVYKTPDEAIRVLQFRNTPDRMAILEQKIAEANHDGWGMLGGAWGRQLDNLKAELEELKQDQVLGRNAIAASSAAAEDAGKSQSSFTSAAHLSSAKGQTLADFAKGKGAEEKLASYRAALKAADDESYQAALDYRGAHEAFVKMRAAEAGGRVQKPGAFAAAQSAYEASERAMDASWARFDSLRNALPRVEEAARSHPHAPGDLAGDLAAGAEIEKALAGKPINSYGTFTSNAWLSSAKGQTLADFAQGKKASDKLVSLQRAIDVADGEFSKVLANDRNLRTLRDQAEQAVRAGKAKPEVLAAAEKAMLAHDPVFEKTQQKLYGLKAALGRAERVAEDELAPLRAELESAKEARSRAIHEELAAKGTPELEAKRRASDLADKKVADINGQLAAGEIRAAERIQRDLAANKVDRPTHFTSNAWLSAGKGQTPADFARGNSATERLESLRKAVSEADFESFESSKHWRELLGTRDRISAAVKAGTEKTEALAAAEKALSAHTLVNDALDNKYRVLKEAFEQSGKIAEGQLQKARGEIEAAEMRTWRARNASNYAYNDLEAARKAVPHDNAAIAKADAKYSTLKKAANQSERELDAAKGRLASVDLAAGRQIQSTLASRRFDNSTRFTSAAHLSADSPATAVGVPSLAELARQAKRLEKDVPISQRQGVAAIAEVETGEKVKGKLLNQRPGPFIRQTRAAEESTGHFLPRVSEVGLNQNLYGAEGHQHFYGALGIAAAWHPDLGEYTAWMGDAAALNKFVGNWDSKVAEAVRAGKWDASRADDARVWVEFKQTGAIPQWPMEKDWAHMTALELEFAQYTDRRVIALGSYDRMFKDPNIMLGEGTHNESVLSSMARAETGQVKEALSLKAHDDQELMNALYLSKALKDSTKERSQVLLEILGAVRETSSLKGEGRVMVNNEETRAFASLMEFESNPLNKPGPQTAKAYIGMDTKEGIELGRLVGVKAAFNDASAGHGMTHFLRILGELKEGESINPKTLIQMRHDIANGRDVSDLSKYPAVYQRIAGLGPQVLDEEALWQLARLGAKSWDLALPPGGHASGVMVETFRNAKVGEVTLKSGLDHMFNGGYDNLHNIKNDLAVQLARMKETNAPGVEAFERAANGYAAKLDALEKEGRLVRRSDAEVEALAESVRRSISAKDELAKIFNPDPLEQKLISRVSEADLKLVAGPKTNEEAFRALYPHMGIVLNEAKADIFDAMEAGKITNYEGMKRLRALDGLGYSIERNPSAVSQRQFYQAVYSARASLANGDREAEVATRAQRLAEDLERHFTTPDGFPLLVSKDQNARTALQEAIKAADAVPGVAKKVGDKTWEAQEKAFSAALKQKMPGLTDELADSFARTCMAGALCGGKKDPTMWDKLAERFSFGNVASKKEEMVKSPEARQLEGRLAVLDTEKAALQEKYLKDLSVKQKNELRRLLAEKEFEIKAVHDQLADFYKPQIRAAVDRLNGELNSMPLRFSKDLNKELDRMVAGKEFAPSKFLGLIANSGDPRLKKWFGPFAWSGTEMGSILQHETQVMSNLEKFSKQLGLDSVQLPGGKNALVFLRDMLAAHDLAKSEAVAIGAKALHHEFVKPVLESYLKARGYPPELRAIAATLVSKDTLGEMLIKNSKARNGAELARNMRAAEQELRQSHLEAQKTMGWWGGASKFKLDDYAKLESAFFHVDASAYPFLFDHVFVSQGARSGIDKIQVADPYFSKLMERVGVNYQPIGSADSFVSHNNASFIDNASRNSNAVHVVVDIDGTLVHEIKGGWKTPTPPEFQSGFKRVDISYELNGKVVQESYVASDAAMRGLSQMREPVTVAHPVTGATTEVKPNIIFFSGAPAERNMALLGALHGIDSEGRQGAPLMEMAAKNKSGEPWVLSRGQIDYVKGRVPSGTDYVKDNLIGADQVAGKSAFMVKDIEKHVAAELGHSDTSRILLLDDSRNFASLKGQQGNLLQVRAASGTATAEDWANRVPNLLQRAYQNVAEGKDIREGMMLEQGRLVMGRRGALAFEPDMGRAESLSWGRSVFEQVARETLGHEESLGGQLAKSNRVFGDESTLGQRMEELNRYFKENGQALLTKEDVKAGLYQTWLEDRATKAGTTNARVNQLVADMKATAPEFAKTISNQDRAAMAAGIEASQKAIADFERKAIEGKTLPKTLEERKAFEAGKAQAGNQAFDGAYRKALEKTGGKYEQEKALALAAVCREGAMCLESPAKQLAEHRSFSQKFVSNAYLTKFPEKNSPELLARLAKGEAVEIKLGTKEPEFALSQYAIGKAYADHSMVKYWAKKNFEAMRAEMKKAASNPVEAIRGIDLWNPKSGKEVYYITDAHHRSYQMHQVIHGDYDSLPEAIKGIMSRDQQKILQNDESLHMTLNVVKHYGHDTTDVDKKVDQLLVGLAQRGKGMPHPEQDTGTFRAAWNRARNLGEGEVLSSADRQKLLGGYTSMQRSWGDLLKSATGDDPARSAVGTLFDSFKDPHFGDLNKGMVDYSEFLIARHPALYRKMLALGITNENFDSKAIQSSLKALLLGSQEGRRALRDLSSAEEFQKVRAKVDNVWRNWAKEMGYPPPPLFVHGSYVGHPMPVYTAGKLAELQAKWPEAAQVIEAQNAGIRALQAARHKYFNGGSLEELEKANAQWGYLEPEVRVMGKSTETRRLQYMRQEINTQRRDVEMYQAEWNEAKALKGNSAANIEQAQERYMAARHAQIAMEAQLEGETRALNKAGKGNVADAINAASERNWQQYERFFPGRSLEDLKTNPSKDELRALDTLELRDVAEESRLAAESKRRVVEALAMDVISPKVEGQENRIQKAEELFEKLSAAHAQAASDKVAMEDRPAAIRKFMAKEWPDQNEVSQCLKLNICAAKLPEVKVLAGGDHLSIEAQQVLAEAAIADRLVMEAPKNSKSLEAARDFFRDPPTKENETKSVSDRLKELQQLEKNLGAEAERFAEKAKTDEKFAKQAEKAALARDTVGEKIKVLAAFNDEQKGLKDAGKATAFDSKANEAAHNSAISSVVRYLSQEPGKLPEELRAYSLSKAEPGMNTGAARWGRFQEARREWAALSESEQARVFSLIRDGIAKTEKADSSFAKSLKEGTAASEKLSDAYKGAGEMARAMGFRTSEQSHAVYNAHGLNQGERALMEALSSGSAPSGFERRAQLGASTAVAKEQLKDIRVVAAKDEKAAEKIAGREPASLAPASVADFARQELKGISKDVLEEADRAHLVSNIEKMDKMVADLRAAAKGDPAALEGLRNLKSGRELTERFRELAGANSNQFETFRLAFDRAVAHFGESKNWEKAWDEGFHDMMAGLTDKNGARVYPERELIKPVGGMENYKHLARCMAL